MKEILGFYVDRLSVENFQYFFDCVATEESIYGVCAHLFISCLSSVAGVDNLVALASRTNRSLGTHF